MPERNPRAGRQGPKRPLASENPASNPKMGRDEPDNPLSPRQCRVVPLCRHWVGAQAHGPFPPPGSTLCSPPQPWSLTSVLHTHALGGPEDRQSQPRPRCFGGPSHSCARPRPGCAGCPSAGTPHIPAPAGPARPLSGPWGSLHLSSPQSPSSTSHTWAGGRQLSRNVGSSRDEQYRWQASRGLCPAQGHSTPGIPRPGQALGPGGLGLAGSMSAVARQQALRLLGHCLNPDACVDRGPQEPLRAHLAGDRRLPGASPPPGTRAILVQEDSRPLPATASHLRSAAPSSLYLEIRAMLPTPRTTFLSYRGLGPSLPELQDPTPCPASPCPG